MVTPVQLRMAPPTAALDIELDPSQRTALDARWPVQRIVGAPGTGKTTVAVEVVAARVAAGEVAADRALVLAATRAAAATLRERLTLRLGGTSSEPLARTSQSFGFSVLRREAALAGAPAPRLLSGPEQDAVLRDMLAGYAEGAAETPPWPPSVVPALATRGLRAELRDLLMRSVEHGLDAPDLARLGRQHDRPEWIAGAHILRDYDQVTALSRPGAYDSAWVLTAVADLFQDGPPGGSGLPVALERTVESIGLIVIDDAQELTAAAARVLGILAGAGIPMVVIGDPDSAVQTFRGADPRRMFGLGNLATPTYLLSVNHRCDPQIRAASARIARRIGAIGGGAQREVSDAVRSVADPEPPMHDSGSPAQIRRPVEVALLRAVSQEAMLIAGRLRQAHLVDAVPWGEMAVIVRGRGRATTLRRVLSSAGVPVSAPSSDVPVRDEAAVRPLLALLGMTVRLAGAPPRESSPGPVDPVSAIDLLTSPIGGCDAVTLRRIRRELRRRELEAGGGRPSDELIAAALLDPAAGLELGSLGAVLRRVTSAIAAGVRAAHLPRASAESVLWAIWDALAVAGAWRAAALAGGEAGARADRDLDAVVALFGAAADHADRLPAAGPAEFLDHVLGQEIAGDSLVRRSPTDRRVALLTPAAAAGRQWRFVAVAGVQEGVWPDLRLRGSLLRSEQLVDVVTGRATSAAAAQAAVRHDETRLFQVALSRARDRVLVTAVRSDDEQPSPYLDIVDPPGEQGRAFTEVDRPMTLAGVVAASRRELLEDCADEGSGGSAVRARLAATRLARLADEGVPGADPARWWGLAPWSDDRPLRVADQPVPISPSKVEQFGNCGLQWLLRACGGEGRSVGAASIGSLVHEIVADLGDVEANALKAELGRRWGQLGLRRGWVERDKRAQSEAMMDRLAGYFLEAGSAGFTRVGAELEVDVRVDRALVRGRVDRVERAPEGGLRVIDYKTGSSKPSNKDLARHPQLGVYQVAVTHGGLRHADVVTSADDIFGDGGDDGVRSAGAALLQVGKAANRSTTLQLQQALDQDPEPGWAEDLLATTAEGMAAARFIARPEENRCKLCPVRSSCPARPEGARL